MARARGLLLIGSVAYALFLIGQLPATLAHAQFGDHLAPLQLDAISGTAWNGRAGHATVAGMQLGELAWRLDPLALVRARLAYRFDSRSDELSVHGYIVRGIAGDTSLHQLQGSAPAATLLQMLSGAPIAFTGRIEWDLQHARLPLTPSPDIRGRATWNDAGIVAPLPAKLGTLAVELVGSADATRLTFTDLQGPVDVEGSIDIAANGEYRLNGRLRPGSDSDDDTRRALSHLGQPDREGFHVIDHTGIATAPGT